MTTCEYSLNKNREKHFFCMQHHRGTTKSPKLVLLSTNSRPTNPLEFERIHSTPTYRKEIATFIKERANPQVRRTQYHLVASASLAMELAQKFSMIFSGICRVFDEAKIRASQMCYVKGTDSKSFKLSSHN